MGQSQTTPGSLLADSLCRRLTFAGRPATKSLLLILLVWYGVEVVALAVGWSVTRMEWAFTTASFPALSPGLAFAIISHTPPPNVTHLLGNAAFLWLFAGDSEQHMHQHEVIGFFIATALVSVTVSTALRGDSTMGASGGALAFVGFYGTHLFIDHRDVLAVDAEEWTWREPAGLRAWWQMVMLLLPLAIAGYSLAQVIGVLPAGRIDAIGHLIGLGVGVSYAVLRT